MLKTVLRPYQVEAVKRAIPFDGFCLFPEQRTGKCLITISIADEKKIDHALVLCPKKAVGEWVREIRKHTHKKTYKTNWDIIHYDAVLANYQTWKKIAKTHEGNPTSMVVADEAHRLKNRTKKISKRMRFLARHFKHRLALTGTPISESLQNAWGVMDFVYPHVVVKKQIVQQGLFGSYAQFAQKFLTMGGFKGKQIVGYHDEDIFKTIFHKHAFRVTLNEARGKIIRVRKRKLIFKLGKKSQRHYDELEEDLSTIVNKHRIDAPLVITQTMKMQQVTGGFLIETAPKKKNNIIHKVGLSKVIKLFESITERMLKEKIVICCRFSHEIELIKRLLIKNLMAVPYCIHGKAQYDEAEAKKFAVVIIQSQAGMAIDLSWAKHLFFYSWDYSFVNYEQMRFRTRAYDMDCANEYYLIAEGTIDEVLYEAVTRKKKFATLVVDTFREKRHD